MVRYPYLNGNYGFKIQAEEFYGRAGISYGKRTGRFSAQILPSEHAFSFEGTGVFPSDKRCVWFILGYLNSAVVRYWLNTVCAQHKTYSYVEALPLPEPSATTQRLVASLAEEGFSLRRSSLSTSSESIGQAFRVPSLVRFASEPTLALASQAADDVDAESAKSVEAVLGRIDAAVASMYGLSEWEESYLDESSDVSPAPSTEVEEHDSDGDSDQDEAVQADDPSRRVANLLMWSLGVAFGRWDIRMSRDSSLIPKLQGPFERLPRVAPGGLVGPDGLPATPDRIASESWLRARPNVITLPEPGSFTGPDHITAADYPIEIAWDGILVDDPGHPRDIIAKIREVLTYVYGSAERAQEIEAEALEILQAGGRSPKSLRDWFRNQKAGDLGKCFFDFHVQRYSKSRRKAPIYWRLTSNPGRGQAEYSVWLYYHRLTGDTLWQVITQYVVPKRELERRRLAELREARGSADSAGKVRIERAIEERVTLLEELDWFESRLRAVAERGCRPDLDDGVIINMAPLHELVPWKEPKTIWQKLEKGDYDWAHLAMSYWPERVSEKCRSDRSLAIAHGVGE